MTQNIPEFDVSPGQGTDSDKPLITADQLDDLTAQERATAEEEASRLEYKSPSGETSEMAAMLHEVGDSDERVKNSRWAGQERWQGEENEAARMVHLMPCAEFLRRLQTLRPDAFLNSWSKVGRIGVNLVVRDHEGEHAKTVTTIQYPAGYEWSVMRFDHHNVPTNEKYRGWRTALLTLITGDHITEEQAHRAFGSPTESPVSDLYRETLWGHRQYTMGLKK